MDRVFYGLALLLVAGLVFVFWLSSPPGHEWSVKDGLARQMRMDQARATATAAASALATAEAPNTGGNVTYATAPPPKGRIRIIAGVSGQPAATAEAPDGGGNAPHSAVPTATPREGNMGVDVPGGHYEEFTIHGGEPLSAVSEGWREGFGPQHPIQTGGATTQLTFNKAWPSTECRTEKQPHKWDGPTVKAGKLTFVRCRYCDLWAQKR